MKWQLVHAFSLIYIFLLMLLSLELQVSFLLPLPWSIFEPVEFAEEGLSCGYTDFA